MTQTQNSESILQFYVLAYKHCWTIVERETKTKQNGVTMQRQKTSLITHLLCFSGIMDFQMNFEIGERLPRVYVCVSCNIKHPSCPYLSSKRFV